MKGREPSMSSNPTRCSIALALPRAPAVALDVHDTAPVLPFPFPVAVKALAGISHKSDLGGVALGIADHRGMIACRSPQCGRACRLAPRAGAADDCRASAKCSSATGSIPQVGPLVMVAAGGIFAEIYRDRSLRLAPVDLDTAGEMIAEVRAFTTLSGYRGRPAGDIAALAAAIVALSQLVEDPAVVEAEVNPLMVCAQGAVAVDALVRMR